jgi:transposase
LDQAVAEAVQTWRFAPVVDALRALRGVNTTIAATVVAEIGDITRFENPRQLMAWLGLVPSEHSSGSTTRRGRLTKTGNALARTMLALQLHFLLDMTLLRDCLVCSSPKRPCDDRSRLY